MNKTEEEKELKKKIKQAQVNLVNQG